jgi:hypothetical protein
MLKFAKPDVRRRGPRVRVGRTDEETYDRHAGNLYRQALFTLDDSELAAQVVSDVIVGECTRTTAAIRGQDAAARLAIGAYRRCIELADGPARRSRSSSPRSSDCAGCAGPGGLSATERGTLGLVLFGGLGYRQAGAGLGISSSDVAAMLRTALGRKAAELRASDDLHGGIRQAALDELTDPASRRR